MILVDVNILIHAHREDAADHQRFREWLTTTLGGAEPFGISELVLSGFVRVVTHRRIFDPPTPLSQAIGFCDFLRARPNAVAVSPGPRHWQIFTDLCSKARAGGDLVADAYLAALAIESGCEWVSLDRDFGRFPELRWRRPF